MPEVDLVRFYGLRRSRRLDQDDLNDPKTVGLPMGKGAWTRNVQTRNGDPARLYGRAGPVKER